jgi:hypothetical protein
MLCTGSHAKAAPAHTVTLDPLKQGVLEREQCHNNCLILYSQNRQPKVKCSSINYKGHELCLKTIPTSLGLFKAIYAASILILGVSKAVKKGQVSNSISGYHIQCMKMHQRLLSTQYSVTLGIINQASLILKSNSVYSVNVGFKTT